VLLPAFVISELKMAFQLGFIIFLPFMIIDIVVSSILVSMGMVFMPPATISLPFKIVLFVLVDGWHLLASALVSGFG
jgi:flagellar biosynthetic protein FliP